MRERIDTDVYGGKQNGGTTSHLLVIAKAAGAAGRTMDT
jgi:hypothetical protein